MILTRHTLILSLSVSWNTSRTFLFIVFKAFKHLSTQISGIFYSWRKLSLSIYLSIYLFRFHLLSRILPASISLLSLSCSLFVSLSLSLSLYIYIYIYIYICKYPMTSPVFLLSYFLPIPILLATHYLFFYQSIRLHSLSVPS